MVRPPAVLCFVLACIGSSFARQEKSTASTGDVSTPTAVVGRVNISPQPDGLAIEIAVTPPVLPENSRLTNPDRLVFDFPGCGLQGSSRRIPVNLGPVQDLRLSLFRADPPVTRVVVDSKQRLDFAVQSAGSGIVIKIPFSNAQTAAVASDHRLTVEHAPAAPSRPPAKLPEKVASVRPGPPQATAYQLLAKAKALPIGDLQPLEDRAQAGDPEAQTTLALAYHTAVLLKKDEAEALRWLHKAADQGFMAAQESLGIFAEAGIGMGGPAPAEALGWYKKAVEQGSRDAATNIALMYADGKGIPRDPQQAATWFRRAAEGGDAAAQYNLALMLRRGNGIPQDYRESVRWLTAAADQNLLPAIMDLAVTYMHPPDSTPADVDRAIHYYEKASDLGSPLAPAILGSIFANGVQGKPDYEQAVKWYRKAADQGQADGQFGLGVRYALGQGVPVDLAEARRLFTAAADQGHRGAQFDLANLYEEGKGTPVDRSLALHYYQLAAEQGVVRAQYRLGLLLAKSDGPGTDRVSACKWLELAQDRIKESAAVLSELRKSMNEQEIEEAEREVDQWRIAHKGSPP